MLEIGGIEAIVAVRYGYYHIMHLGLNEILGKNCFICENPELTSWWTIYCFWKMTEAAFLRFTSFQKDLFCLICSSVFSVAWFLEENACAWTKAQFSASLTDGAWSDCTVGKTRSVSPTQKITTWASCATYVHVGAKRMLQAICRTVMV